MPERREHVMVIDDSCGLEVSLCLGRLDVYFVNTLPVRAVPGGLGHSRVGGNPGGEHQGYWMPAFAGMTFSAPCTGA